VLTVGHTLAAIVQDGYPAAPVFSGWASIEIGDRESVNSESLLNNRAIEQYPAVRDTSCAISLLLRPSATQWLSTLSWIHRFDNRVVTPIGCAPGLRLTQSDSEPQVHVTGNVSVQSQ
jgi:hypothetical protein